MNQNVEKKPAPEVVMQRERYEFNKLRKRLRKNVGAAINDFNMICEGDRVFPEARTHTPCWTF